MSKFFENLREVQRIIAKRRKSDLIYQEREVKILSKKTVPNDFLLFFFLFFFSFFFCFTFLPLCTMQAFSSKRANEFFLSFQARHSYVRSPRVIYAKRLSIFEGNLPIFSRYVIITASKRNSCHFFQHRYFLFQSLQSSHLEKQRIRFFKRLQTGVFFKCDF